MKNTFKRNLLIGFGLSILLLIIGSVASYVSINNLLSSSQQVNHTNEIIKQLENSISVLKDAETGQRGYLLTGDERFLEPYNGSYEQSVNILNHVQQMTTADTTQQKNIASLKDVITQRLTILANLIKNRRAGQEASLADLQQGKLYMDSARALASRMETREQAQLEKRTLQLNRFASSTPILIIITSILSIIVTLVFFFRVNSDFARRTMLQKELQEKDQDITRRINIIQDIANKIAGGDYTIRAEDSGEDGLGNLSYSLNQMAGSLEKSFTLLSDKEWLQSGIAGLNEKMLGQKTVSDLTADIINYIATYTGSQVGAFYLMHDDALQLSAGFALAVDKEKGQLKLGEGLAGQVAATGKEIMVSNIQETNLVMRFAAGEIKPQTIIAVPVYFEQQVKGVIELGTADDLSTVELDYIKAAADIIGIVIHTAENRQRLQELLEETQAQSEELQAQHGELENINSELEAQAEKLQASEEELKVQQEELLEANRELEERSRLLEERNQMIVERNLEIQQQSEELALSSRYKSEFLANMSHELRTPLNSVLLLARLLSENNDKNLTPEQIEYANVIQSSGKGLLTLIDEILDLSKIEAGKMDLEYAMVPVSDIASDMKAMFAPIAKERNLDFQINIAQDVPQQMETDTLRLEQVLKNLLSNALKFTKQGFVHLNIENSPGKNEFLQFKVQDTGIGIPQEKQQLIFEAFQQADGSTRRKFGGTGLGLSISRELTKLLGGDLTLTSEPSKGSEFTLEVPVQKTTALAPKPQEQTATSVQVEEKKTTKPADDQKHIRSQMIPENLPDDRAAITEKDKTILIIEDDTAFAKALLNFTHKRGYKGLISVRGDEGIELAKQYKPQGILLDLQLPVKDGWEVMEELKSNPETRHIPVHIMSSLEAKKESLVRGAVDFINKPVAFDQMQEVFAKIENVLSKKTNKVLIVEENPKHAKALAYFLETFNVNAQLSTSVNGGVTALQKEEVDCVILDMGIPDQHAYETLESVKKNPGLENLPIIIFTGRSLSATEESRIRQYADSIVIKTAHSYQRILDEVSLFLHLMEENKKEEKQSQKYKRLGALQEVLAAKKILVTDDDVRNIFSLTKALELHDMKVITAIDGKEALKQLEEHPDTDVVLMDIMMPDMDGYEAMQAIRKKPQFRNLPIIAVTAKAMTGDREKSIKAGASDYISKPVDIDQLLSLLRVWLYDKS